MASIFKNSTKESILQIGLQYLLNILYVILRVLSFIYVSSYTTNTQDLCGALNITIFMSQCIEHYYLWLWASSQSTPPPLKVYSHYSHYTRIVLPTSYLFRSARSKMDVIHEINRFFYWCFTHKSQTKITKQTPMWHLS